MCQSKTQKGSRLKERTLKVPGISNALLMMSVSSRRQGSKTRQVNNLTFHLSFVSPPLAGADEQSNLNQSQLDHTVSNQNQTKWSYQTCKWHLARKENETHTKRSMQIESSSQRAQEEPDHEAIRLFMENAKGRRRRSSSKLQRPLREQCTEL